MEVEVKMMELILFLCICFSFPIICGIIGALIISIQTKKQYKEYARELHKLVNETCAELEESEQELQEIAQKLKQSINKQKQKRENN